jgi:hypothetical protein
MCLYRGFINAFTGIAPSAQLLVQQFGKYKNRALAVPLDIAAAVLRPGMVCVCLCACA